MSKNIFAVIADMLGVIPKKSSTLEFARTISKIGEDAVYSAPTATGIHWQRLTECVHVYIPSIVGTTPLWHIQILSIVFNVPVIEFMRRGCITEPNMVQPVTTLNRNAVSVLIKITITKDRVEVKVPQTESDDMVARAMKFGNEIAAEIWNPAMHSLRGVFSYVKPDGGFTTILRSDDKINRHFFMEKSYWREPRDY